MNIQMKQRYILPALLLLCAACQQEEWAQPEADSSDAIRFAADQPWTVRNMSSGNARMLLGFRYLK